MSSSDSQLKVEVAKKLLRQRLDQIKCKVIDTTPPLTDVERAHILFVPMTHKIFRYTGEINTTPKL